MTIKDLQLYKENNQYYLSAVLNYEDKTGLYEISIPKIKFPISNCQLNNTSHYDFQHEYINSVDLDFGFCRLEALPFNDQKNIFTLTCLEEKVCTMTLAEIEKELGYKIKLKEN